MIAEILMLSVAVWRISHLVTSEVGPARILERFRTWAGVVVEVLDDGHEEVIVSPGTLAELVTCQWCASVWVGMAAAMVYAISPRSAVLLAMPFFLSGLSLLYGGLVEKFTKV
jgi:hypothetical protein